LIKDEIIKVMPALVGAGIEKDRAQNAASF
jgi:hypothetical protein